MAARRPPGDVMRVMVAFSQSLDAIRWARSQAIECWGPLVVESPVFDFDQTDYYRDAMGADLKKVLWAHQPLSDPGNLAGWKRQAIGWEEEYQRGGDRDLQRVLNLDPGYVTEAKLVLATTKDRDHRIYLNEGIHAEVTLVYQKRQWQPLPWTYPDFRQGHYFPFLDQCRVSLRERYSPPDVKGKS